MLNVAVVGLGSVSPIHLIAVEQAAKRGQVRLAAVCDIDPTTFAKVGTYTTQTPDTYTDYGKLLKHPDLDAVHLCLPHYLHVPYTKQALAAGLHVFLEKPMGLNLAECRDLVAFKNNTAPDRHAAICLQNRLNRTTEVLREKLQGTTVTGAKLILAWGRPKAYYEAQPWRGEKDKAGSGVLLNQAIHSIDLLQYLVGPVKELAALSGQLLDYGIEVEDSVVANFKFTGGQTAFVAATLANCCNSSVEIEIYTKDGTYQIKDYSLYVVNPDGIRELVCRDDLPEGGKIYYGSSHTRLIHKFYNAILGETEDNDYIPLAEALPGMAIVEAILAAKPNTTVHVEQV